MKAYRHADGSIWTFRPEANAAADAAAAPAGWPCRSCPRRTSSSSLRALVEVDQAWVPTGASGRDEPLPAPVHVRLRGLPRGAAGRRGDLLVIASPAGAYFSGGIKPVTLWISTDYARAGEGGTGAAKCGGNYASSLAGQLEGIENGCDQAVFLDSSTHTYIEELGGMNLFFVTEGQPARHARADRLDPRGRHPLVDPRARQGDGAGARGAPDPDPGVEGRRGQRRASSRSSRAAPRRSSRRSASCAGTAARATTDAASTTARSPARSASGCSTSSTAAPRTPTAG